MGVIRITLPRLGETMEEARVTEWLKAPGDAFRRGDVLLEVETDKTVVEVPALHDGTLLEQLVVPGETVALDQPIAVVSAEGAAGAAAPAVEVAASEVASAPPPAPAAAPKAAGGLRASPLARRLGREVGVDLATITGSGRRGRIMAADVRALRELTANSARHPLSVRRIAAEGRAGAPVLLVHGVYDDGRGWRDLPERLAGAGHPVIVPDLPGPASSLDEALDLLARLVPEGPVRLAGHSLGAALCAMLAARLGPRVEKLVLIAPTGLGARIDVDFLDLMARAETPSALARGLARLGGGPMSEAALASELVRIRALRPALEPIARAVAAGGIQQLDIVPYLARIASPVAAVFGLEDRIIDWRDCAALPATAAIHLVAGAGHLPHLKAADLVSGLIADPNLQTRGAINEARR
jgi:pyruvate dehydrogenase E2 component (dihydrolipoamide acetyltransferase)